MASRRDKAKKTRATMDVADVVLQQRQRSALKEAARARKLLLGGALPAARKSFEASIAQAPYDMDVVALVADGLAEMGHRDRAIEILQAALAHNPANETVLLIVGKIAQNMDCPDIAAKVFAAAIDLNPSEPSYYVNLAESYRQQERVDEAVDLVKGSLEMFPESAMLWNLMGTLMINQRNNALALTFYQEALRLEPGNDAVLLNIANLEFDGGDPTSRYRRAIALNPDNHAAHVGLATYLLLNGDLKEGWEHYEHRKLGDEGYGKSVRFTFDLPEWTGQTLAGKSILVMAEQGLGDELLFGLNFKRLYEEAGQLYIGCDPRLVSIFKRSFPNAIIAGFEDQRLEGRRYRSFPSIQRHLKKIDYGVWAGSVPQYWWPDTASIPHMETGYIKPETGLVETCRPLVARSEGRLKVGISWRSGNLSFERSEFYMGLRGIRRVLANRHIDCYCFQYGWDQSEIDWLQKEMGYPVFTFPDIDLKDDLEANLALMAHMDVVIGPATATQQLAMSAGVPAWTIMGGAPWWQFGHKGAGPAFAPASVWSWCQHGLGQEGLCRIIQGVMGVYFEKYTEINLALLKATVDRVVEDYMAVFPDVDINDFMDTYEQTLVI